MPSEPEVAYVWLWLPGATEPVPAGWIERDGAVYSFAYGSTYLSRPNAVSIYGPELPLNSGPQYPRIGELAGSLRDGGPDRWGRRVIEHRLGASMGEEFDALTYLLESESDRIGALDFQASPTEYVPRSAAPASLEDLVTAAERLERREPLPPALEQALFHGSAIGGTRPKALLDDSARRLIAKFSSSSDPYPVVKGEYVAMELARRVGLDVAPVELVSVLGRDVLLVERFDRTPAGARRAIVSGLTILGLDEMTDALYGSYVELATRIRTDFTLPDATLRELFGRITFNILVGNNDDHARNHAAFWDGDRLTLTPAFDVTPQPRSGETSTQQMAIGDDGYRESNVFGCVERAAIYHLAGREARGIVEHQIEVIRDEWQGVCDAAELSEADRERFWGLQFLNPGAIREDE